MKPIRGRAGERGAELVEMALLLPIMMLVALIVGEGAQAIRAHIVLNNAAREGARISSLPENQCLLAPSPPACTSAIQTAVATYASNNGISLPAANVAINQNAVIPNGATGMSASLVTVTYQYPLTFLPALAGPLGIGTNVTLVGRAEFRNFYGP